MLRLDRSMAPEMRVGDVDVRRWDQFAVSDALPFFAMWYSVPPGGTSPRDAHPELELSVVVAGRAHVESDSGAVTEAGTGEVFILSSGEGHVVHNRSTDTELTIFSAYWWPDAGEAAEKLNLINRERDESTQAAAAGRPA